jgi:hypothetical protein
MTSDEQVVLTAKEVRRTFVEFFQVLSGLIFNHKT